MKIEKNGSLNPISSSDEVDTGTRTKLEGNKEKIEKDQLAERIRGVFKKKHQEHLGEEYCTVILEAHRVMVLDIKRGLNCIEDAQIAGIELSENETMTLINPKTHILIRSFLIEAMYQRGRSPIGESLLELFEVEWKKKDKLGIYFNRIDFFQLSFYIDKCSPTGEWVEVRKVEELFYLLIKKNPGDFPNEVVQKEAYDWIITRAIENDSYGVLSQMTDEILKSGKDHYKYARECKKIMTARYFESIGVKIDNPEGNEPLFIDKEMFRERSIGERF